MQPPAHPNGQLHGLWPRQQHAEIQRREIFFLIHPLTLFNHFTVHQRNLPRRPAKRQKANAREGVQKFAERRGLHGVQVS